MASLPGAPIFAPAAELPDWALQNRPPRHGH